MYLPPHLHNSVCMAKSVLYRMILSALARVDVGFCERAVPKSMLELVLWSK